MRKKESRKIFLLYRNSRQAKCSAKHFMENHLSEIEKEEESLTGLKLLLS